MSFTGSQAPALVVIHKYLRDAVVLAGTDICSCNICIPHIPVGYAGTQAQGGETSCYSSTCRITKLPSMALDTGIHAGMTTLKHTCV